MPTLARNQGRSSQVVKAKKSFKEDKPQPPLERVLDFITKQRLGNTEEKLEIVVVNEVLYTNLSVFRQRLKDGGSTTDIRTMPFYDIVVSSVKGVVGRIKITNLKEYFFGRLNEVKTDKEIVAFEAEIFALNEALSGTILQDLSYDLLVALIKARKEVDGKLLQVAQ